MWLSNDLFRSVVASTPLVSIDLVVLNAKGECLLGQRLNRPAKGSWFVPGGRILKNETLDSAFKRLTQEELGQVLHRSDARLLGVYEHFYADSVFGADAQAPDTHYVVLAYQLVLAEGQELQLPHAQHGDYHWWPLIEMQTHEHVHANTRAYLAALR
ncbi:GDP-mannose mannosyl hydrolase [Pseudomonas psychrophila]|uniref:GDP-mannose mannosyl hydrolase n=1 Tax=Pseudomonas psychrophila TaxID=122355 RepID=UPI0003163F92|nr:GDP-mannose mannosyl hydrolase [Pseudomonas psychrophila]